MEDIKEFRGQYWFLSNYYPCLVSYKGLRFTSSEAAFQAQKCPGHEADYVNLSADDAKHYCRTLPLRPDWEQVKVPIMEEVVRAKFTQNKDLANKLIDTGDALLEEGNWWWDSFWGVYQGKGENVLGKILMKIREELRCKKYGK